MPPQNLAGAADYRIRKPGEPRDFDSITLIRASRFYPAQKDNFAAGFLYCYVYVLHSRQQLLELRKLVIMRGKKRLGPRARVQRFHHGPRNRKPVKCRSSAADFVEE